MSLWELNPDRNSVRNDPELFKNGNIAFNYVTGQTYVQNTWFTHTLRAWGSLWLQNCVEALVTNTELWAAMATMVAYRSQLILDQLGDVCRGCSYALAYSKSIILLHLSILKLEVNPEHPKVIFVCMWCVTGCWDFFFYLFAVYSKIHCSNQIQGIKKKNDLPDQNTYLRQNQSAWDFFLYLEYWKSNNLFDKNVNVHACPLGIDEFFK